MRQPENQMVSGPSGQHAHSTGAVNEGSSHSVDPLHSASQPGQSQEHTGSQVCQIYVVDIHEM